ncbi:MAG: hypothetical protein WAN34_10215 [Acidimicrobiia bacterium]
MLRVHCPALDHDTLIWPSDLLGMSNNEFGIVLRFRCNCGQMAEILSEGPSASTPRLLSHAL